MNNRHGIEGYIACRVCGRLVLAPYARQTNRCCPDCWTGGRTLDRVQVMNRTARSTLRVARKDLRKPPPEGWTESRAKKHNAAQAAYRRLAQIHADLYAVLYDEERVRRGLHPVARYNPIDFDATVAATLNFDAVYDALDSSGATDGP